MNNTGGSNIEILLIIIVIRVRAAAKPQSFVPYPKS